MTSPNRRSSPYSNREKASDGISHEVFSNSSNNMRARPDVPSSQNTANAGPDSGSKPFVKAAMHHRRHDPTALKWHEEWTDDSWSNGRVLTIDYMRWNRSKGGKIKIIAQEHKDLQGLKKYYSDSNKCKESALRVVHVQNAPRPVIKFLMHKYNVAVEDDLVGMDFGKWVEHATPEWRAGKPLLKGKTWRAQRDPWRAVRRTAFGLDYLRACDVLNDGEGSHLANSEAGRGQSTPDENKMMELNCYDESDAPCYGWDVFVQRLSCYIQFSEGASTMPEHMDNPYSTRKRWDEKQEKQEDGAVAPNGHAHDHKFPPLDFLDNGNTIIIFENSRDSSVLSTLIGARQQVETRWRKLSFYLPQEDIADDSRLALECMDLILEDVFKALGTNWETFLGIAETHIAILEDKIYDSPADESRAPELWYNSAAWLKVERLAFIHQECVKELLTHLDDLHDLPNRPETSRSWLDGVVDLFQKITTLVQEDLVKPTNNLNDLMYKSVEIRDSRQSLGLNTSMWRLSWITFIFLPLTFIVGFFGMNVDTFQNDPSIKWYFIAAVPLMILVLILWYILKHSLASKHQTPYQKGVFEHMFHDLANQNPQLWSRAGPRRDVQPEGFYSRIRWWLLRRWFDPRRTIAKPTSDPDEDVGGSGLGAWARCKRMLARKWLTTIDARRRASISDSEQALNEETTLSDLAAVSISAATAETVPPVAAMTRQNLERLSPYPQRDQSGSPRNSMRPSSSGGSSGVMVDERDIDARRQSLEDAEMLLNGRGRLRRSIDGVMENFGGSDP